MLNEYFEALKKVYDHLGFIESPKVLPIKDFSNFYWAIYIPSNGVVMSPDKVLNKDDEVSEILSGYPRSLYEGENFTGVLIRHTTQMGGNDVIGIFDNTKRLPVVNVPI